MEKLFTCESVTEGHPDKICDQISDAVLDAVLKDDAQARVACEVVATTGQVIVLGEMTTSTYVDVARVAHNTIKEIGYDNSDLGFDHSCAVNVALDEQSPDISMGVSGSNEYKLSQDPLDFLGAGDQGMVFGYACNDTDTLMPLGIHLAHALTRELAVARKNGSIPYLRPDGKAQVTIKYQNGVPHSVDTVVVSTQHSPQATHAQIKQDIIKLITNVIPHKLLRKDTNYYINPTGQFIIGGPHGDTGLTGRKIIVDTYGGYCPHGGGAFSGKDPSKVDRSAAYMARYACKNLVAAGLCDIAQIQVAYAIARAKPVSVLLETFGTHKIEPQKLEQILQANFDFRPSAIIKTLDLQRPIYLATAKNGHFGNSNFAWEKTELATRLKGQF